MKDRIARIVTALSTSGAVTHLLPYEARLSARRSGQDG